MRSFIAPCIRPESKNVNQDDGLECDWPKVVPWMDGLLRELNSHRCEADILVSKTGQIDLTIFIAKVGHPLLNQVWGVRG